MIVATAVLPLSATSATAAACVRGDTKVTGANGYARTVDVNGFCGTVGANAGFSTAGTTSTIWTGFTYHADVAVTPKVSNLVGSQHSNS